MLQGLFTACIFTLLLTTTSVCAPNEPINIPPDTSTLTYATALFTQAEADYLDSSAQANSTRNTLINLIALRGSIEKLRAEQYLYRDHLQTLQSREPSLLLEQLRLNKIQQSTLDLYGRISQIITQETQRLELIEHRRSETFSRLALCAEMLQNSVELYHISPEPLKP